MNKKLMLIIGVILVALIGFFWMRSTDESHVQMNNKMCPVSGNPVNNRSTYVHEGKAYNLCSEECKQPLSDNPEKYLPDSDE